MILFLQVCKENVYEGARCEEPDPVFDHSKCFCKKEDIGKYFKAVYDETDTWYIQCNGVGSFNFTYHQCPSGEIFKEEDSACSVGSSPACHCSYQGETYALPSQCTKFGLCYRLNGRWEVAEIECPYSTEYGQTYFDDQKKSCEIVSPETDPKYNFTCEGKEDGVHGSPLECNAFNFCINELMIGDSSFCCQRGHIFNVNTSSCAPYHESPYVNCNLISECEAAAQNITLYCKHVLDIPGNNNNCYYSK